MLFNDILLIAKPEGRVPSRFKFEHVRTRLACPSPRPAPIHPAVRYPCSRCRMQSLDLIAATVSIANPESASPTESAHPADHTLAVIAARQFEVDAHAPKPCSGKARLPAAADNARQCQVESSTLALTFFAADQAERDEWYVRVQAQARQPRPMSRARSAAAAAVGPLYRSCQR